MRDLRYNLDSRDQLDAEGNVIRWIHDVPLKVTCMVWRANLGRLPTACELIKRGVTIATPICSYCGNEDEDVTHVLWRCSMAKTVWLWVFKWCDIPIPDVHDVSEILSFVETWSNDPNRKRNLLCICYGTLWMIWKVRCDWIFKKARISPTKVADNIKAIVYTWVKYRRSKCFYKWEE